MSNSPEEWYYSLPKITRYYLTACFLTTSLVSFGFLNPYKLHLDYDIVLEKYEIWRFITCFIFLGKFSLPFVMQLYFLVSYSSRLELGPFPSGGGPTADYVYMLFLGASVMWMISFFFGYPFLGSSMIFMILYIWSRREPEMPISFWGLRSKGLYLPWLIMAFSVLTGGSPIMDLIGVAAGHVYYFLLEVLPQTHNIDLISTPIFLMDWFPSDQSFVSGGNMAPRHQVSGRTAGHSWGSGHTLGSN